MTIGTWAVINKAVDIFSEEKYLGIGNKFAIEDNIAHDFLTHFVFIIWFLMW